jgi:ribonuclease E
LTRELAFHSNWFPTSFPGMAESEKPVSSSAETSGAKPAPAGANRRRGRRGGRGRRKPFTPRPGEAKSAGAETPELPAGASAAETTASGVEPIAASAGERLEAKREPAVDPDAIPPRRPPEPIRPLLERVQRLTERVASRPEPEHRTSAIHQAIDEVMEVVEALKRAVDQMEEVLELVELAERQKLADEREIESLRRALRQFHDRPERAERSDRARDPREQRGPRDSRGPREPRENRPPQREPSEPRGPRDFREPQVETPEPPAAPDEPGTES